MIETEQTQSPKASDLESKPNVETETKDERNLVEVVAEKANDEIKTENIEKPVSVFDPENFDEPEPSSPSDDNAERLVAEPTSEPAKPDEATPAVIPEKIFERLTELETELESLRTEKEEFSKKAHQELVEARRHFLINGYKMKSDAYLAVADQALPDIDPRTQEGEESFRKWAIKHPELFESAPKMPIIEEEKNESGIFRAKNRTWRDVFKT